jgi:opacity protein-like surface antigen
MKTTLLALLAMLCIAFAASAADATGKWTAEVPGRGGNQTLTFNLSASGNTLTGSITTARGDSPIEDGKVDGDTITFTQSIQGRDGNAVKINYTGKVSADHIDFTRDAGRGPVTFTAKKS